MPNEISIMVWATQNPNEGWYALLVLKRIQRNENTQTVHRINVLTPTSPEASNAHRPQDLAVVVFRTGAVGSLQLGALQQLNWRRLDARLGIRLVCSCTSWRPNLMRTKP